MYIIIQNNISKHTADLTIIAGIVGRHSSTVSRWLQKGYHYHKDYQIYDSEHIKGNRGQYERTKDNNRNMQ